MAAVLAGGIPRCAEAAGTCGAAFLRIAPAQPVRGAAGARCSRCPVQPVRDVVAGAAADWSGMSREEVEPSLAFLDGVAQGLASRPIVRILLNVSKRSVERVGVHRGLTAFDLAHEARIDRVTLDQRLLFPFRPVLETSLRKTRERERRLARP